MSPAVVIDGVRVAEEEARVSVFDRGFLYGDGVFEVMRTFGGRPCDVDAHLARLGEGCRALAILPIATAETWRRDLALALSPRTPGEHHLRLIVTRGRGRLGVDPADAGPPTRVVIATPIGGEATEEGVRARTVRMARATDVGAAHGAKVLSYLGNVLALAEARAHGAEEALLLGPDGEVYEGATSNLFVLRAGVLSTPPVSSALLAGTVRARVIDAARAMGLVVGERALFPHDLYGAEEVWLTSSVRVLLPVVEVDGCPVGVGRVGPVSRALHPRLRALLASLTDPVESGTSSSPRIA